MMNQRRYCLKWKVQRCCNVTRLSVNTPTSLHQRESYWFLSFRIIWSNVAFEQFIICSKVSETGLQNVVNYDWNCLIQSRICPECTCHRVLKKYSSWPSGSMDHHGVQRTDCMDIKQGPSRGVPCWNLLRKTDQFRLDPTQRRTPGRRCDQVSSASSLRNREVHSHLPICDHPSWLCPARIRSAISMPAQ